MSPTRIGDLFIEEPTRWGLRGDPLLWQKLQKHFESSPLPASEAELMSLIEQAFVSLTGKQLSEPEPFFVASFTAGGLSSGGICPAFWRDTGLPLLLSRWTDFRESNPADTLPE